MPDKINIVGSTLQGAFAVGSNATSSSHGNPVIQGQTFSASFERLSRVLSQYGVSDTDIADLGNAIETDKDSQQIAKKDFGPEVSNWIRKMFEKAGDTIWKIKVSAAGNIFASAIRHYYGWP